MIVKQTFLVASLLLLALPANAMQIDYGDIALNIQFDTTWTLDGQPTTIKTGSLTIGNGATFSLLDNPSQSVEWFASTIDVQGNFFAPGLTLILHADQITINGSLSAGSLAFLSNGSRAFFSNAPAAPGCNGTAASSTLTISHTSGGFTPTSPECVVNDVSNSVTLTGSVLDISSYSGGSIEGTIGNVVTYGGIITATAGEITFISENTVTLVPLSDSALYFSAALLPLLRRAMRRKQLPA
jgi:hypothetical protein